MINWPAHGTRTKVEPHEVHAPVFALMMKEINASHQGHEVLWYETFLHGTWNNIKQRYIEDASAPSSFGRVEVECKTCGKKLP